MRMYHLKRNHTEMLVTAFPTYDLTKNKHFACQRNQVLQEDACHSVQFNYTATHYETPASTSKQSPTTEHNQWDAVRTASGGQGNYLEQQHQ